MAIRLHLNPDLRMLRQFGLLCVAFSVAVAYVHSRTYGADSIVIGLFTAATVAGVSAVIAPRLLKPIFVAWSIAAFPIGWIVSHLILALLFYGVFTPVGFALRILRVDSLQLQNPKSASHWKDRSQPADLKQYFRQY
jgi:hypothetical protein